MLCFLRKRKHPGIAHDADAKHAVSVIHVSNGFQTKDANTTRTASWEKSYKDRHTA